MRMTLGMLAVRHGCELRGDPDVPVDGVATLATAGEGSLAFLANPQYRAYLAGTRATAVVLALADAPACPVACLISANPYLAYAGMAADLHPPAPLRPGIAPGAHVARDCELPASCQVEAGAVIGAGAIIGERVFVGPNAVIAAGCRVGESTRIMAGVVVGEQTCLGRRCLLHAGVVIGADGFGIARSSDGTWTKVPQLGGVVIGDDVEIGANTTIDRGAIGDTVIGNGVKLDNQIQIGHNVRVGAHTAMAGCVGVAGSTRIGRRCTFGGGAIVLGHLTIADDVNVSAATLVTKSIRQPGTYTGAMPFEAHRDWLRNASRLRQLDLLAEKIHALEARLAQLEKKS